MPYQYARLGQAAPIEVKTVLPGEGEETKVLSLSIGGQIRQFISKPISPENIPAVKKAVEMFYKSGESLKEWRDAALALRDIAYVQWPDFVKTVDFSAMTLEDQKRFEESKDKLFSFAEDVMNQYGIAQKDWDAMLSEVDSIKQEVGMAGLGDPAIFVLIIIAIVAIAAAASTVAVFSYMSESEVSDRVMAPANAIMKIAAAKGELAAKAQQEIVNQQKQLREDLLTITDEKTRELLAKNYQTSVNGLVDSVKTMNELEKVLPAIAENQVRMEEQIAKQKEAGKPLAWLKYLPFVALGVMGIILAPSIKEMLPKPKRE